MQSIEDVVSNSNAKKAHEKRKQEEEAKELQKKMQADGQGKENAVQVFNTLLNHLVNINHDALTNAFKEARDMNLFCR